MKPSLAVAPSRAIAASLLAALSMGVSKVALAEACGPLVSGSVTCVTGNNPYAGGINYGNTGVPTTVTLQPGVVVDVTPNTTNFDVSVSTGGGAGTGNPATLTANNAAVNLTTTTGFSGALVLHPIQGNATITASGIINVTGGDKTFPIAANSDSTTGAVANVTYTGSASPGKIDINATGGANSALIEACVNDGCGFLDGAGNGNAIINATGNLTGNFGSSSFGLQAVATGNGTATVNYNGGTINLTGGSFNTGIFSSGGGGATLTTLPGTTVEVSSTAAGAAAIAAFSDSGAAVANVASTILVNGSPTPQAGDYRSQPAGILVQSDADGSAEVDYNGPGITVHGVGGLGIAAVSRSGSATVDASGATGPIIADGSDAVGILADSGTLRNAISGGNPPAVTTGPVLVTASNVSATGRFGTAISANGGSGNVTITIPSGGSIMGGWQATPFTIPVVTPFAGSPLLPGKPPTSVTPPGNISSVSGLPAAGIFLGANGGTATLTNNVNGSIGALSDLAILGDPQIINEGSITGFVQFTGGSNSIQNDGIFNLRNFAETMGNADGTANGVRDTVRVAVADLGTLGNNTFTNSATGTLSLSQVTGATTLVNTGQYLPLNNSNNTMTLNGPLQGQLVGVSTFTNSGIIDLQANPVPGDVLMITGGRGGSLPRSGGGTFVSNGGSLKLDTVLNQGGAASFSDVLVVDGTSVGPGGATRTFINNAGGTGGLTVEDGILVVQVLDPLRSAAGAFTLANAVAVGPFEYFLFQGGVNGRNPGDWFLRNTFIVPPSNGGGTTPPGTGDDSTPPSATPPSAALPTPPVDPFPPNPPPGPLPPGVYPIIGPRLSAYGVVQPIARQLGLTQLGTLHERIGDTLTVANAGDDLGGWASSAWGRVIGQTMDNRYQAFADPRADGHIVGMQAGIDLLRASFEPGHRDVGGLYFSYLNGNADVDGLVTNLAASAYVLQHTGTVNLNAYSLGGYWTHYGPGDWYLDAVLQGTRYGGNTDATFGSLGFGLQTNLSTSGSGFVGSLEGGYPIPMPQLGPNFILEPQAQIIWQHTDFDQANDGISTIALGSTSGTTGRLGVRGQWTIPDANGVVWQPYGRFNVWQDWGGAANTLFAGSGIGVPLLNHSTRLEFAGGLTYKLQSNLSFYAQAGYEFAISPDTVQRDGFKGDVGLRYTW